MSSINIIDVQPIILRFGLADGWDIAPGASSMFRARFEYALVPRKIEILGFGGLGVDREHLVVTDIFKSDSSSLTGRRHWRVNPMDDLGALITDVSAHDVLSAIVKNTHREITFRANPIVTGAMLSAKNIEKEYWGAMKPDCTVSNERIGIQPDESVSRTLSPSITCRPTKITMRSNSMGDVWVKDIKLSNVPLIDFRSNPIPVEFFANGVPTRTLVITPNNSISVTVYSTADDERWVEIDVEVVPAIRGTSRPADIERANIITHKMKAVEDVLLDKNSSEAQKVEARELINAIYRACVQPPASNFTPK